MLNIYITDLAAYNAGALIGRWVSLPITRFELNQVISEILTEGEHAVDEENHEKIFITDYEWSFMTEEIREIDEYENIDDLNKEAFLLSELDADKLKAVKFLLDEGITSDTEDGINKAKDVVIHHNQDLSEVAFDLLQECYSVDSLPSIIANNIDYDRIARDLEYDGTYWELGDDVFEYIG